MNDINSSYNCIIETLISIFTIKNDHICVLLFRKKQDPYKGYWLLPTDYLRFNETLEKNIINLVYNKIGVSDIYIENCNLYSDINRDENARIIGASYLGIVNNDLLQDNYIDKLNIEYKWFNINNIPKMGYDHGIILSNTINKLKDIIVKTNILKYLFPATFTMPELFHVFEQVLDKSLDRRNFRKKFINLGIVEKINFKDETLIGRPAQLYRFKENIEEKVIFR